MQFPYYQFSVFGDGFLIGTDAVLHVFISHGLAIGVIAMIVLAEYIGYRYNRPEWERFARSAMKPAVIIITSVGAITGVGIWFTTSGVVPAAIGSMLRVFFWPWLIEWVVFALEVIVILIMYFTWDYWQYERKKYHIRLGFAYMCLACMSAFLITGILGFMLTPDGWPSNRSFWSAFFNPTFLPQLAWRIVIAFAMGALFTIIYLLFFSKAPRHFRKDAMKYYARILVVPLILMPFCAWWWYYMVPEGFRTHAKPSTLLWVIEKNTGLLGLFNQIFWISLVVNIIIVFSMLITAEKEWVHLSKVLVIPATIIILFFVAEYERVREFIRGPYLMPGYMYANTILLTEHELLSKEGLLKNSYWFDKMATQQTLEQKGAYLFAMNCGTCHTIGGRNSIIDRFKGRSEPGIYVILGNTEEMVPWRPPFTGTNEERKIMAHFLKNLIEGQYVLEEPSRYPPMEPDKK
ncbi:MAG: cytochrome ubiquinol oxidase subunit I [Sedimentisphaerales bacterium]